MQDKKEQQNVLFGQRLESLMSALDMSQTELAGEMGLTQAAIANYVKGRIPRAEILSRFADFFGVSVDDLLNSNPSGINPSGEKSVERERSLRIHQVFRHIEAVELHLGIANDLLALVRGEVEKLKPNSKAPAQTNKDKSK